MTQPKTLFGIYVNPGEKKAVRITSPYWIPEPPDWVFLTEEANATLLKIRELAKEKGLVSDSELIQWDQIPVRD